MPYHPKTCDLSDAVLKTFVGGQITMLLSLGVGGFAPKRYCGEVMAINHEGSALRFWFAWIAECMGASAPDAAWMGARFPEGACRDFDLAVWDVANGKDGESLEFILGATGGMATLRPSTSEKLLKPESVSF